MGRGRGRGWAAEEEERGRGRGVRGKWRGGKGRAPKLLLNQGPSEPCYATESRVYCSAASQVALLKSKFITT